MGRCAHQEPKLYRWNARSAQEHSKLESKMASAARTLKGRRNHSLQSWKLQGAACRSQSTWAKKQKNVVLCCLCTRGCPKFHDKQIWIHIYIYGSYARPNKILELHWKLRLLRQLNYVPRIGGNSGYESSTRVVHLSGWFLELS